MAEGTLELKLVVDIGPEADKEELETNTLQLRDELMDLDVENVDLVCSGDVPANAKAGDPISWGTLLLTLAASGGVITTLINSVQSWLIRNDRKSITLELDGDKLDLKGVSTEEQKRLINEWLKRRLNKEINNG